VIPESPLAAWIGRTIGARPDSATLVPWQMARLRETLALAKARGPFYRERLAGCDPAAILAPGDLCALPFTTADDLRARSDDFLCVSQSAIARALTLQSSGTTGTPKRFFFTDEDLEATVDFFRHGMSAFAGPGDKVAILMPGGRPGTVGDLLRRALARLGAQGHVADLSLSVDDMLDHMAAEGYAVAVCLPSQAIRLARTARSQGRPRLALTVLLGADHAAPSLRAALEEDLCQRCVVHWGMSETCLSGAVECLAGAGCHIREADLFLEIVHPETGAILPDGEQGEIVLTTLRRQGMPLVRYRTGDLAVMDAAPCPCGSPLRRLGRFGGRIADALPLPGGKTLSLAELDQALFALPGILGYEAGLRTEGDEARLEIAAQPARGHEDSLLKNAADSVAAVLGAKGVRASVRVKTAPPPEKPLADLAKRTFKRY